MTRTANLPRRDWHDVSGSAEMVDLLTEVCRMSDGVQTLRPVQAAMLCEGLEQRGLFCQADLGAGKTFPSMIMPWIFENNHDTRKPVLMVPAGIRPQTDSDLRQVSKNWQTSRRLRIVNYEWLGNPKHEHWLFAYLPDLLFFDEADKLRNRKVSATARRVDRYIRACRSPAEYQRIARDLPPKYRELDLPDVAVFATSATLTKESILDYAHILTWCLRDGSPVPSKPQVVNKWAQGIDANERDGGAGRVNYVAISAGLGETVHDRDSAREAFHRRLADTPGCIMMTEVFKDVPLYFHEWESEISPEVEAHLTRLRKYWEAPDGWAFGDARFEVWACARQLALDFCYVHEPRPPQPWFDARRAWGKVCRAIIERTAYDSATLVEAAHRPSTHTVFAHRPCVDCEGEACEHCGGAGMIRVPEDDQVTVNPPQMSCREYDAWVAIRDTHTPVTVPIWFADRVLHEVIEWVEKQEEPPLIWIEHKEFGNALANLTGWRYYSQHAKSQNGQHARDSHPRHGPALVSYHSCARGLNLQAWSNNLVVSPHSDAPTVDQMIGRAHRSGQTKPVHFTFRVGVAEHRQAIRNATERARYAHQTTGRESRLLIGDWI